MDNALISAVIITKNEERNIRRCLESLQGVADEIIVLDSHSTDGTKAICAEFGVRFVEQDWLGYATTKNQGNSLATHDFVLSLDADEALSPTLREAILAVKPKLENVYSFNRLTIYCGQEIRHCGWYPDRKPRLFRKGAAAWEGAYVHETLVPKADVPVQQLKGDLLHYSYYSIGEHVTRTNKYAELAAQRLVEGGKSGLLFKALFSPGFRFFKNYVLRLGFLDGFYGLVICTVSSWEVFLKYAKAIQQKRLS